MGSNGTPIEGQATTGSTPEDVANLYAWAHLHGAKYRDYSASRREHRAQVRYRAAKALLDRELKAEAEAEASAEAAEREARDAEARALSGGTGQPQHTRFAALRTAEAAALRAAADRVEAARRAEAAAHANVIALREQRELAEASASAAEQAMIYTEVEALRRQLAGPQPHFGLNQTAVSATAGSEPEPSPVEASVAEATPALPAAAIWQPLSEAILGEDKEWTSAARPPSASVEIRKEEDLRPAWFVGSPRNQSASEAEAVVSAQPSLADPAVPDPERPTSVPEVSSDDPGPSIQEQHLTAPVVPEPALPSVHPPVGQDAVQQVNKDQPLNPSAAVLQPAPHVRTPLLAIFSLAGGAGATSAVAGTGRALSAAGEKVLLVDATSQALLPFYFGGRELRDGLMRTWSPPQGTGEDVSLILHNATHLNGDAAEEQKLMEQIWASAFGTQRILVDLSAPAAWLFRRWAFLAPAVLVPLIPGMDSLIHVEATETLFRGMVAANEQPLLPFYLLNRFDASLALHRELRSLLERRLGDRLLRFTIRNSAAIPEALADGSTVLDYAPVSDVAREFHEIASWLRHLSPARAANLSHLHWGEF